VRVAHQLEGFVEWKSNVQRRAVCESFFLIHLALLLTDYKQDRPRAFSGKRWQSSSKLST